MHRILGDALGKRRSWRAALLASTILLPLLSGREASAQAGPFIYVPNSGANNTFVIDTSTNAVIATIAAQGGPGVAAVSGDESIAYVAKVPPGMWLEFGVARSPVT